MKYSYYNANPLNRRVNDCTVRAISLATKRTWDTTFEELSKMAQAQAIMPDDVTYIDEYLERKYHKICGCKDKIEITVEEFVDTHPHGIYLITMRGHITCVIDGCIYDTFDPRDRIVWAAYEIEK